MKYIKLLLGFILILNYSIAQNVGINVSSPNLAKLQVAGTFGLGKTVAAFGSDRAGISLQRSSPAIGFNQYKDASSSKYMSDGYAAAISMDETTGVMAWDMV